MRNLMECVEYSTFTAEDEKAFLKEGASGFVDKFKDAGVRVMNGIIKYWTQNDPQAGSKLKTKIDAAIQDASAKMRKLGMKDEQIAQAVEKFNELRSNPVRESMGLAIFSGAVTIVIIGVLIICAAVLLALMIAIVTEPFYIVDDLLTICGIDFPLFRWIGQATRFLGNKPGEAIQMFMPEIGGLDAISSWDRWDGGSQVLGSHEKAIQAQAKRY